MTLRGCGGPGRRLAARQPPEVTVGHRGLAADTACLSDLEAPVRQDRILRTETRPASRAVDLTGCRGHVSQRSAGASWKPRTAQVPAPRGHPAHGPRLCRERTSSGRGPPSSRAARAPPPPNDII